MKATGAEFDEVTIPLGQPDTVERAKQHSPVGLVPVIHHGNTAVWDSLAIAEYAAETWPEARLWPEDPKARARARSVSAEMHSGFNALRNHLPMSVTGKGRGVHEDAADDIRRVQELWNDCKREFGGDGPYLFGHFSIADAFFAPVVFRFRAFGVEVDEVSKEYMTRMLENPWMKEWEDAAKAEELEHPKYDAMFD